MLAVYGFENATPVEASIHQRFTANKERGEWFGLVASDLKVFHDICCILGGAYITSEEVPTLPTEDEVEEAEEMAEPTEAEKWDFSSMFADGWQMEYFEGRRKLNGETVKTGHTYWQWTKFVDGKRQRVYGGSTKLLPYSVEEMRSIYRDNK